MTTADASETSAPRDTPRPALFVWASSNKITVKDVADFGRQVEGVRGQDDWDRPARVSEPSGCASLDGAHDGVGMTLREPDSPRSRIRVDPEGEPMHTNATTTAGERDAEAHISDSRVPFGQTPLLFAGSCSIAAGVVHVTASQMHAEHVELSRLMLAEGTAQVLFGAALLVSGRVAVRSAVAAVSGIALAAWLTTRIVGISWVPGLAVAEAPQAADTVAALLAAAAVLALVASAARNAGPSGDRQPAIARSFATVGVVALVPMVGIYGVSAAGTHEHDHAAASDEHDHAAATPTHGSGASATMDESWKLGASESATADTQGLIAETQAAVQSFTSIADAESKGFVRINGDHLLNRDRALDDKILDPNAIESLVVGIRENGEEFISGGMYLMGLNKTMRDVPRFGGPLTVWHSHGGFCFLPSGVITAGTEAGGTCAEGSVWLDDPPMLHIYTEAQVDDGATRTAKKCGTFVFMDLPFDRPVPGCAAPKAGHSDGIHAHS